MGGSARDEFDVSLIGQTPECSQQIPIDAFELIEAISVVIFPKMGKGNELIAPVAREFSAILARGPNAHPQELFDFGPKRGSGELLRQHGGEIDRQLRTPVRGNFGAQKREQREIAVDGDFGKPIAPVRPPPVSQDKGKMRVEGEREVSQGIALHCALQGLQAISAHLPVFGTHGDPRNLL